MNRLFLDKNWSTLKKLLFLKAGVGGTCEHTVSGEIASFITNIIAPLKKLLCNVEPVQSGSGEPSPDNVRPISGWTGAHVYHSGSDMSNPGTISITFPSSAGTVYGGTLTINEDGTGELVVDRAEIELSENWYWFVGNTQPSGLTVCTTTTFPEHIVQNYDYISNTFKKANRPYVANMQYLDFLLSNTGTSAYFCFKNETGGTAQEFKDFIVAQRTAGTPIQVVYELATPVTYQLTDLEVIKTLKGVNNVWADTGDVEVTYLEKS